MYPKTRLAWVMVGLAGALGISGCRVSANFHEIDPGRYYRSAQLTKPELNLAIDTYGIKTIINLRGEDPKASWFRDETQVAKDKGVTLINIPFSNSRLQHRRDLLKLLDSLRNAPRPILLHCRVGADRTGEASVIYQMEYMGKSKEEALEMLTPKYHHIELFVPTKRYFIQELYAGMDDAYETYFPCKSNYKYYDKSKYCRDGEELPAALLPVEPEGEESPPPTG
ncbi:MAG: tyrosine protein phosphatase [Bacteriovoracia bacterium]